MLSRSIGEALAGQLEVFEYSHQVYLALQEIWLAETKQENESKSEDSTRKESDEEEVLFSRNSRPVSPTPWAIAFTPTFQKSIANIDKKIQGRILMVILELAQNPLILLGDTKKPLVGEKKGLWRYRLGDHRLIYEPDEKELKVILLEFAARGSVYE